MSCGAWQSGVASRGRHRRMLTTGLLAGVLFACGAQGAQPQEAPTVDDDHDRRIAIESLGEELYNAIVASAALRVLADESTIRELLDDEAADRYAALRLGVASRVGDVAPHAFADTEYAGICLQGLREEAEGGPVGLRGAAWVFDRALIVASKPGGQRVAAWVEGVFVGTVDHFVVIDLHRVEDPRWEHSDLEIAHCDVQIGMRQPQDVGMVTP